MFSRTISENDLKRFQRILRITNNLVADIWGHRDRFVPAKNIGINDIYVELDSQESINLIME